jgi:hypothetical protein
MPPLTPAFEYFLSESQWIEAQPGNIEAAYAELIDAIREPNRTALTDILLWFLRHQPASAGAVSQITS